MRGLRLRNMLIVLAALTFLLSVYSPDRVYADVGEVHDLRIELASSVLYEGISGHDYAIDLTTGKHIPLGYFKYEYDVEAPGNVLIADGVRYTFDEDLWRFVDSVGNVFPHVSTVDDQSVDNPWGPDNPGHVTVHAGNAECRLVLNVVKSPIWEFRMEFAKPQFLYEEYSGSWLWGTVLDEETGKMVRKDYFHYRYGTNRTRNAFPGDRLVINGKSYELEDDGNNGFNFVSDDGEIIKEYNFAVADNQSVFSPWHVGLNEVEAVYLLNNVAAARYTYNVEIKPNPADSISFKPANGKAMMYVDESGEYKYKGQIGDVLTINYNDGRGRVDYEYQFDTSYPWGILNFIDADGNYPDGEYSFTTCEDGETWGLGVHTLKVQCWRKTDEVPIEVVNRGSPSSPCRLHDIEWKHQVDPKCLEMGSKEHYRCRDCGRIFADQKCRRELTEQDITIPATGHSWDGGRIENYGGHDYKVFYCTNELCGASYVENPVQAEYVDLPSTTEYGYRAVKLSKAKAKKNTVTLKWKKLPKSDRKIFKKVEIQYSTDRSFSDAVTVYAGSGKTSKKIKGLEKGRKYYFRARGYTSKPNGIVISKWSKIKAVKGK